MLTIRENVRHSAPPPLPYLRTVIIATHDMKLYILPQTYIENSKDSWYALQEALMHARSYIFVSKR